VAEEIAKAEASIQRKLEQKYRKKDEEWA